MVDLSIFAVRDGSLDPWPGHQLATALYALARLEAKDSVSLQQEGLW